MLRTLGAKVVISTLLEKSTPRFLYLKKKENIAAYVGVEGSLKGVDCNLV